MQIVEFFGAVFVGVVAGFVARAISTALEFDPGSCDAWLWGVWAVVSLYLIRQWVFRSNKMVTAATADKPVKQPRQQTRVIYSETYIQAQAGTGRQNNKASGDTRPMGMSKEQFVDHFMNPSVQVQDTYDESGGDSYDYENNVPYGRESDYSGTIDNLLRAYGSEDE